MDAYHAPYTKEARYWTGLFLTFAINTFGSNGINILAVSIVSGALLAVKQRVYENWVKDILESSLYSKPVYFQRQYFILTKNFMKML
jgi:hypothetical protein